MNKSIIKTLILVGVLSAFAILGRALYYAPNGEIDSGLEVSASSSQASVGSYDKPSRLIIPSLKIDADVQRLGVTKSGNMAAPNNFTDVSWYKFGTVPGVVGSAVISGHEDNAISLDGVFKHLENLKPGDDVYIVSESGQKIHFRVIESQVYPYDKAPTEKIFNSKDKARLNLITCAGNWLASAKTNDHRLVVYTELVD